MDAGLSLRLSEIISSLFSLSGITDNVTFFISYNLKYKTVFSNYMVNAKRKRYEF